MDHTIFWYWYYYERCIDTLRCYDSSFLIYYSYLWITNYTNIIWWWLLLIWQLILLLLLLRQLIFLLLFKSMKIHQHHLLAICYDSYFCFCFSYRWITTNIIWWSVVTAALTAFSVSTIHIEELIGVAATTATSLFNDEQPISFDDRLLLLLWQLIPFHYRTKN